MTATGELIPLPMVAPVRIRSQHFDLQQHGKQHQFRRPRIYRIPNCQHAKGFSYGPNGCTLLDGATGKNVDIYA